MSGTPAFPSQTIRSVAGIVFAAIVAAVGAFLLGDAAVRGAWDVVAAAAPWVLLIVWATYVTFSASFIRLDADAVTVQNLLRRHRIPWGDVTGVAMKYQLVISASGRDIACWAGPSAGRPRKSQTEDGGLSPAMRVTQTVTNEWQAHRGDPAASGPTVSTWDWILAGVGAALLAWALLSLAF